MTSPVPPSPRSRPPPIYVLYGSATGNAEHIAKNVATSLLTNKDNVVVCSELDSWKKKCPNFELVTTSQQQLLPPCTVLIVASTTGNGDAPENASRFVRTLKRTKTQCLTNVSFAVLGLGDTNYDQYCAVGKLVDKKMAELGATRILALSCADEAIGLEDTVEPWTQSVLELLTTQANSKEEAKEEDDAGDGRVDSSDGQDDDDDAAALATRGATADDATAAPTSSVEVKGTTDAGENMDDGSRKSGTGRNHGPARQMLSIGAVTVRSLLGNVPALDDDDDVGALPLEGGGITKEDGDNFATTPLSPMHHVLSNCELYHPQDSNDDDEEEDGDVVGASQPVLDVNGNGVDATTTPRRKSRGMSIADDTVSTASTGFVYHAQNPYVSRIVNARYLTQTDWTPILNELDQSFDNSTDDNAAARVAVAMQLIDRNFQPDDANGSTDQLTKRVVELTLQLPDDTTIEYAPGDSLGVVVPNPSDSVQFVLDVLERQGLQASTLITVDQKRMTVRDAVTYALDVSTPCVPKRILQALSQHDDVLSRDDRIALTILSGKTTAGLDAYRQYVENQRLTLVDILRDFPSTQLVPWRSLLGMLTSIPPRYYSVSSSPLVMAHSLTVAFSVVDYVTPSLLVNGHERGLRRIRGVATRYMEALVLPLLASSANNGGRGGSGDTAEVAASSSSAPLLRIFPKPTTEFRMPHSLHDPLILIGPGTGIAPFMGFVAHRQAMMKQMKQRKQLLSSSDRLRTAEETVVEGTWRGGFDLDEHELPVTSRDAIRQAADAFDDSAPMQMQYKASAEEDDPFYGAVDVYFGCRHKDHDWLYRDEMIKYRSEGAISRLCTAFSRDESQKVYVQHLMKLDENQARIADLIVNRGAKVYLCGDGNAMAKDVNEVLVEVLASHLPGGNDEARSYLERMRHDRRFLMDIWS